MSAGTRSDASGGGFAFRVLDQASRWINQSLAWVAAVALLAMMAVTVADILLRLIGLQIAGTYELVGWLAAAAMGLSLGYVQLHNGHVSMTIISDRLRGRTAAVVRLISSVLSLGLVAAVTYYVGAYGLMQQATGSLSETLRFIVYPWVLILTLGLASLTLALFVDAIKSLVMLFNPLAFGTDVTATI